MRVMLNGQQLELKRGEAIDLVNEMLHLLRRPIDQENKLQCLEVLAFPYLERLTKKLAKRLVSQPQKSSYKITLSVQELIALRSLLNDYPVSLYNTFIAIDRKALSYDQVINLEN